MLSSKFLLQVLIEINVPTKKSSPLFTLFFKRKAIRELSAYAVAIYWKKYVLRTRTVVLIVLKIFNKPLEGGKFHCQGIMGLRNLNLTPQPPGSYCKIQRNQDLIVKSPHKQESRLGKMLMMLPNGRTGLDLRFWGECSLWIGQQHDICAESAI